jgi:hypothetical protein
MTATARRIMKQPDRPKNGQGRGKINKVIPIREPLEPKKPIWTRSESYRLGNLVGRYMRLERDSGFSFHLVQQLVSHCNEADFASGFHDGFLCE